MSAPAIAHFPIKIVVVYVVEVSEDADIYLIPDLAIIKSIMCFLFQLNKFKNGTQIRD